MSAKSMVKDPSELDILSATKSDGSNIVENVFYDWEIASNKFFSGN